MPICYFIAATLCVSLLELSNQQPEQSPPSIPLPRVECVRALLGGHEFKEDFDTLVKMGDAAFPAYEAILSDPKCSSADGARVFVVLRYVKGERGQFVDFAVARLADENKSVRWHATRLLEKIGSERDCAPVVVLLSDQDIAVRRSAAETLSAIGGKRELAAMDVWLRVGDHRSDGDHVRRVKEQRDALKKRLDAEAKKLRDGG